MIITCELARERKPSTLTRAERAQVLAHFRHCKACRAWVEALGPPPRELVEQCKAMLLVDYRDPEFREVFHSHD